MRSLMLANPLAPAAHVRDALCAWGIEVSAETARRDQRLWGFPSTLEQRARIARGFPPVGPSPAFGSIGHRVIRVLQSRPAPTEELAAKLGVSPHSIKRALKTSALFTYESSGCWSVQGGPRA